MPSSGGRNGSHVFEEEQGGRNIPRLRIGDLIANTFPHSQVSFKLGTALENVAGSIPLLLNGTYQDFYNRVTLDRDDFVVRSDKPSGYLSTQNLVSLSMSDA